jgi:hypothetical protein
MCGTNFFGPGPGNFFFGPGSGPAKNFLLVFNFYPILFWYFTVSNKFFLFYETIVLQERENMKIRLWFENSCFFLSFAHEYFSRSTISSKSKIRVIIRERLNCLTFVGIGIPNTVLLGLGKI